MAGRNQNEDGSGQASGALPIAAAIGSRNLILIIVAMPLVFMVVLLGTILIFGKHSRNAAARNAAARNAAESADVALPIIGSSGLSSAAAFGIDPAPLILPAGADILAMAIEGDRLVLHIANEDGEGGEIIVYDLAGGAPVRRIPVIRQIAAPGGER